PTAPAVELSERCPTRLCTTDDRPWQLTRERLGVSGGCSMRRRAAEFTTTPETPAPRLFCPTCDQLLVYRQTVFNGVQPPERWDYFHCATCGPFEYRHRTRRLRETDMWPMRVAPFKKQLSS